MDVDEEVVSINDSMHSISILGDEDSDALIISEGDNQRPNTVPQDAKAASNVTAESKEKSEAKT